MPNQELERRFIMEYGEQMRELYPDLDWEHVEPLLRKIWEDTYRLSTWESAKDLMYAAWRSWGP